MAWRDWIARDVFIPGIKRYLGYNALITFLAVLLIGIERGDVLGYYGTFFLMFGAMSVGFGRVLGTISGLMFDPGVGFWEDFTRFPFQMRDIFSNGIFTYEHFSNGLILIGIAYIIGFALTVLAAIHVGRKAYNTKVAFGTWFLISTLGAVFGFLARMFIYIELYWIDFMWFGLAILVNGMVFGAIAALTTKRRM